MALLYDVPRDVLGLPGGRVDQLDFLLGTQEASKRVGFPVCDGGECSAYKWRHTSPQRPLGCAEEP